MLANPYRPRGLGGCVLRAPAVALLLAALTLAGCSDPTDDPVVEAPKPLASLLHDLSPMAFPDLASTPHFLEHHRIGVRETVELDSYVWRPDLIGRTVPVVLVVTPYYGGGEPDLSPLGNPADGVANALVPRGYAVGFLSVTGTGDSGGCFSQGGPSEATDIAAAVEYFGTREWSNGNVGLIGVSYDGTTPQETWVEAPTHLKSIVPVSGISDLYKYDYVNGVPISVTGLSFTNYYWALTGLSPVGLSGGVGPTDPVGWAGSVPGEGCTGQVETQEAGVGSHGDGNKDAYWQERDFLTRLQATPDKVRAPVFYVHGLQDYNVKPHHMEGWLEAVQATGVPFKAFLGQWEHAWPDNTLGPGNCVPDENASRLPTCRADWWNATLVAWFDQTLKGRDTGIYDLPRIQVQDDSGIWRGEDVWPPTNTRELRLHPDASGALQDAPGDGQASYFDYWGGVDTGDLDFGPLSVAFVSEPITQDLHVSGLPTFHGRVTATGHYASLVLTLAVRNDTSERSINFAAQSLNHVQDLSQGRDIAGLTQEVTVDFLPSDDVVPAGSRIVLYAAGNNVGSDYGGSMNLQPVSDGSTITLDLAGAWLSLPIDETIVPEDPQPFEPMPDEG